MMFSFFFFQAEDGIRDADVTGVQTCALPILSSASTRVMGTSRNATSATASARTPPTPSMTVMPNEIGRASCRERVEISVVVVSSKEKQKEDKKNPSRGELPLVKCSARLNDFT